MNKNKKMTNAMKINIGIGIIAVATVAFFKVIVINGLKTEYILIIALGFLAFLYYFGVYILTDEEVFYEHKKQRLKMEETRLMLEAKQEEKEVIRENKTNKAKKINKKK